MSRRGGYKIIDLRNKKLTIGGSIIFDGIYEEIKNTTKPILLSGINISGSEYKDRFVEFNLVGSQYTALFQVRDNTYYHIGVSNTDVVTITDVGPVTE